MSTPTYFFAMLQGATKDPLEGKFATSQAPSPTVAAEEATPLKTLLGLYWFVELPGERKALEHKALSTEEVVVVMDSGRRVRAISGPFRTRVEAEQSLERCWEMIMDDDPE